MVEWGGVWWNGDVVEWRLFAGGLRLTLSVNGWPCEWRYFSIVSDVVEIAHLLGGNLCVPYPVNCVWVPR